MVDIIHSGFVGAAASMVPVDLNGEASLHVQLFWPKGVHLLCRLTQRVSS
jgi:hypothetical protein